MVGHRGIEDSQGFVPQRFRILRGQTLHLEYISDTAATVRAWARLYYDNGVDSILYVPDQELTADRVPAVLAPSDVAIMDGWIVDAVVECVSDGVRRGQAYIKLSVALPSLIFGTVLCSDYVYSTFGMVVLGTTTEPGPGGGSGHLRWVTVKADGLPATFNYGLAVTNVIRLVRALVWYYAASGVAASRTLQATLRSPGGSLPTGMAVVGSDDTWVSSILTLTLDQDGSVFADPQRSGVNDNGAVAIDDTGSAPTPFPLLVPEVDGSTLQFTLTNVDAGDFDAVYGLFEDWLVL